MDEHAVHVGEPGLDGARRRHGAHCGGRGARQRRGSRHLEAGGRVVAGEPAAERLDDGAGLRRAGSTVSPSPSRCAWPSPRTTCTRRCPPSWPLEDDPDGAGAAAYDVGEQQVEHVLDRAGRVGEGQVALDGGGQRPVADRQPVGPPLGQLGGEVDERHLGALDQAAAAGELDQLAGDGVHLVDAGQAAPGGRLRVLGQVVAQGQVLELQPQPGQRGAQHVRGVLGEVPLAVQPVLELAGAGAQRLGDRPRLGDPGRAAGRGRSGPGRARRRRRRAAGTARTGPRRDRKPDQPGERPRSAGTATSDRADVAADDVADHRRRLADRDRAAATVAVAARSSAASSGAVRTRSPVDDDRLAARPGRTRAGRRARRAPSRNVLVDGAAGGLAGRRRSRRRASACCCRWALSCSRIRSRST